jgi:hypothetical protein
VIIANKASRRGNRLRDSGHSWENISCLFHGTLLIRKRITKTECRVPSVKLSDSRDYRWTLKVWRHCNTSTIGHFQNFQFEKRRREYNPFEYKVTCAKVCERASQLQCFTLSTKPRKFRLDYIFFLYHYMSNFFKKKKKKKEMNVKI